MKHYENWFKTDIHPKLFLLNPPSENGTKELLQFATSEKDRIMRSLMEMDLDRLNGSGARFIQYQQVTIINLANALLEYQNDYPVSSHVASFYMRVSEHLESILLFLQRIFSPYFDFDLPVTKFRASIIHGELSASLKQLEKLNNHPKIQRPLLGLALQPIRQVVEQRELSITFRNVNYLRELVNDLMILRKLDDETDINWELHATLLQLNFNLPRYILYCTSQLDLKLSRLDQAGKLDMLAWYIRTMQQIQYKPGFALISGMLSAQEQIIASIRIAYKDLLKISDTQPSEDKSWKKIRTSLSVPELGVLLKLFIDGRIFIPDPYKIDIVRTLTKVISTVRVDNISEKSLRSKLDNTEIEPAAVEAVKGYIINFLNMLNKM